MSHLPKTWLSTSLGQVVEYGITQKAEPNDIADNTWVLELEDIEKDTSKLVARVSFAERQSKSTKNRFETGDILYGKLRPYLNKVILADQPGVCTTEIVPIKANEAVNSSYLFYWLKHPKFLGYVTDVSHGVNMPRLGTEAGRAAPFVLAPLPEQKRIADKLDRVFARVDACRERLARVQPLLKRFRQSVLAAATSGALTADWRAIRSSAPHADVRPSDYKSDALAMESPAPCEFVSPAKHSSADLFASMGNQNGGFESPSAAAAIKPVFNTVTWTDSANSTLAENYDDPVGVTFELPINWSWRNLSNGVSEASYGTSSKSLKEGSMPVLRMGNLQGGKIDWSDLVYSDNEQDNAKYALSKGDILFNRTNSPELVGKTSIYLGERPAIYAGYLIRVRCKIDILLPEYLNFCLNSPYGKSYCWAVKSDGVSQSNINAEKLRNLPIPYCSIEEQHEIVRRVETLFAFSDRLEARLAAAQSTAGLLTPALLAKAFRGELVLQDPNDEPAAELLKKLAEARAAAPKPKRGRKGAAT